MIVAVPPLMPGLINSINTNVHVGVGTRLFDLAYLLGVSAPIPLVPHSLKHFNPAVYCTTVQFTLASTVYFTLSRLFPAQETMLDHAITEQEALPYDGSISGSSDEKKVDVYRVDESAAVA
jgi:nucleobase:cation symporter-1, NCS1 family